MPKIKITHEGQPCRNCRTPVLDVKTGRTEPKPGKKYGYSGYFLCPNPECKSIYMDDTRRVYANPEAGINNVNLSVKKQNLRQEIIVKMQQLLHLLQKEAEL